MKQFQINQEPIQDKDKDKNKNNKLLTPPPNKTTIQNTAGKTGKSHHSYLKILEQYQPVKQLRDINKQQLNMHKSVESAWLSLYGIVYDVTIYVNYHPGGKIILQGCGKQCSDLFNQVHPWVNAKYLLQKFKIGYLQ